MPTACSASIFSARVMAENSYGVPYKPENPSCSMAPFKRRRLFWDWLAVWMMASQPSSWASRTAVRARIGRDRDELIGYMPR